MTQIKTVLVATDFSPHSAAALSFAIDLARHFEAEVHLLHAYQLPYGVAVPYDVMIPQEIMTAVRESAARRVEKAFEKVQAAGLEGCTHVLGSTPVDAIVETARALAADLVVVGTRGLTGIKHALLGSVAERVVHLAPCPVLTVKGDDPRD